MVQESTSRPVDGDTAWLSCHRKISGLDSSRAESHTSTIFISTERQRSTRRAFGWEDEVAAWKRSIPRAHKVKEVMPRDTTCREEEGNNSSKSMWQRRKLCQKVKQFTVKLLNPLLLSSCCYF